MNQIRNKKMKQVILCRAGKCVDLYLDTKNKNFDEDFLECEVLKEKIFQ
jgi:hypothetical protein